MVELDLIRFFLVLNILSILIVLLYLRLYINNRIFAHRKDINKTFNIIADDTGQMNIDIRNIQARMKMND